MHETSSQPLVENTFDHKQNPAVGHTEGAETVAPMKNIAGLVKVRVTGKIDLRRITLMSNSDNELIAGTGTIDAKTGELTIDESEGSASVTLTASKSIPLTDTPKTFYFVVAPRTFASGFTLTFIGSKEGKNYRFTHTTHNEATNTASKILNITKVFDIDITEETVEMEPGITYTADLTKEPGSRVSDVKFYDGTPLDPDARYKVVINSYLGGGGDGYTMLNVLDETKELASDVKIITHVNKTYMRQALQAYFEKSTEEKPIRVDMNETRIRLITEETFVNPFTDVAETDWFYDVVLQLAKDGIVNGMTETTFEPQGTLTRAEFATMLYRVSYAPVVTGESTYSDVKTGDWYYDAVVWATEAGVVNGMGDGTFAPNDNITRQEMATMLYRLAKAEKVEEDKLASFPDAESVADWAKDAMNWAVSTEIVNGSTHDDKVNYLDPTATALRCQAAAVACRYLALSK